MEARPVAHPSDMLLQGIGLGKLDDTTAENVIRHLEACEPCRRKAASQSDDDFVKRLRAAQAPDKTPAPDKGLRSVSRSPKAAGGKPVASIAALNLPPELVDHLQYEIIRELGRGGMGVVFLAKNKLMDRMEVLKVVSKKLLDYSGATNRFLQEIRSAAKLSHPNVVAAYSVVKVGKLLAFAMEYVDGEDLSVVVKARGALPVAKACYYVQQAALGLQHAFEKGAVHRDIKPHNLILSKEGKKHVIKILDFGLAKARQEKGVDHGLTGEGMMLGTPDYVAPEQTVDASSADIRADIYSLGCTLYYLLTGSPPFRGNSLYTVLQAHHSVVAKPLNLVRPEVPEELAAVVGKMMAKEPDKRYQKPVEVVQALMSFVKQGATGPSPGASPSLSHGKEITETRSGKDTEVSPEEAPVLEEAEAAIPATAEEAAEWVDPFADLGPAKPHTSLSGTTSRPSRTPAAKPRALKWWLFGAGLGAVACLLLLISAIALWPSPKPTAPTPQGTIVLEHLPRDAEVLVDGGKVPLKFVGRRAEIRIDVSNIKHRVEVKYKGYEAFVENVEVDAGMRVSVDVQLVAIGPSISPETKESPPTKTTDGK